MEQKFKIVAKITNSCGSDKILTFSNLVDRINYLTVVKFDGMPSCNYKGHWAFRT